MSTSMDNNNALGGQLPTAVTQPTMPYLITQNGGYYRLNEDSVNRCQDLDQKSCCHGAFGKPEQTAKYVETDPYSMKPNVKVDFGELFQEPEGSEGFSFIWKYNKIIYSWTSRVFYSFLAGILGPILAVCWGLIFATMNFLLVWTINPATKLVLQLTRVAEVLTRGIVRATLDPLFQAFGQIFTFLRGSFSLRVAGLEGVGVGMGEGKAENGMPPAITPLMFKESTA